MKTIKLVMIALMMCFITTTVAQTDTSGITQKDWSYINSIKLKAEKNEQCIRDMKLNFNKFNRQYNVGTNLIVSGIIVPIIGTCMSIGTDNTDAKKMLLIAPSLIGTVLIMSGYIVQVNAHKYIGRAGNLSISATGAALTIPLDNSDNYIK